MPYRVDLFNPLDDAIDRLSLIGALDIALTDGGLAAILPDHVSAAEVAAALDGKAVTVSPAVGRDDESTWIVSPHPARVGRLWLTTADVPAQPGALRLRDSQAFGTGFHPTTRLCLEAIDEAATIAAPRSLLDVGTGSGILALAALTLGVPRALGLDVDRDALDVADQNARLNDLQDRLDLVEGDASIITDRWPLVVANVAAAPLIEVAPAIVRCLDHQGRLILSGIAESVVPDVERVYRRAGLRFVRTGTRAGWSAIVFDAPW